MFFNLCVFPLRLQSGVNLQVCFVNDSSSDKDSDAEDSRTETSLDTPLSPVVCTAQIASVFLCGCLYLCFCFIPAVTSWYHFYDFLSRASRVHRYLTETRRRRILIRWMTAAGSGGCSGGCRRRPGWRWLWPDPWPACRWRWRGKSNCTDVRLWLTWLVSEREREIHIRGFVVACGALYVFLHEQYMSERIRTITYLWHMWRARKGKKELSETQKVG